MKVFPVVHINDPGENQAQALGVLELGADGLVAPSVETETYSGIVDPVALQRLVVLPHDVA